MTPGIRAARPHLAFLVGLAGALAVMWKVRDATGVPPAQHGDPFARLVVAAPPAQRAVGPLTDQQRRDAAIAWQYFVNNYIPETGMVNSVDNYESTSLWDLGSYMMGVLAARDLGVVGADEAHQRLSRLLDTLAALPLVEGLPNKAYNTRTLAMVDYDNRVTAGGVGWSAIDIARLSVPMTIVVWRDPDLAPKVRAILGRWALARIVAGGRLQGAQRGRDGALELVQEGRLGYEQYAAQALWLLGLDVENAARWDLSAAVATVSGQAIPYDSRMPDDHAGTHNAVVSEPFLLAAFEMGLTDTSRRMAESIYAAQRDRAAELGKLVAVSEDNIDRPPFFVYNSVLNGGRAWQAFAPTGEDASAHRSLSTKAAFGWGELFADAYADRLLGGIAGLYDAGRGWYSGIYDADGKTNRSITANTNGIILEILWFHTRGPLIAAGER